MKSWCEVGKESYYIVSQFDLEEYAEEAPMFRRLSGWFDRCIYGCGWCAMS
jgi:hypothetical protein